MVVYLAVSCGGFGWGTVVVGYLEFTFVGVAGCSVVFDTLLRWAERDSTVGFEAMTRTRDTTLQWKVH